MGTTKTKEMLVDVARKLFAAQGVENTTMNDIAQASKKGRRTLYTYFKNKDDIYFSVVENELNQVAKKLELISKDEGSPDNRLIDYIYMRMEAIKEVVTRNGNLKADFFLDIHKVARVRRQLDRKEKMILKDIITDSVEKGVFKVKDVVFASLMIHLALKGFEVSYIKGELQELMNARKKDIVRFLFNGL
ncbi:MAG TPA: TetR/AcrR family transcriptional regulator [Paludibacteraceae bacterium]|nr:TetR/AcrR family transcriptional regulator [Paludibacteraceae bacterium]HQF50983.1 TetR/AcrR family transcriptional regulator [Paludibacteraceae bacterium]HQJ91147.1 TetR/AcrR family transcriptional regulator [Paludibacteraceae bacterium]